jgi:hypothetical protein
MTAVGRRLPISFRGPLVAILTGALLFFAGCGTAKQDFALRRRGKHVALSSGFGQFAGYNWLGHVNEVAATWTVPRIIRGRGAAGTWIGAEAAGKPGPFIQIGTNEQRGTFPGQQEYFSFWSDTSAHFHAIELFGVHPGDRISARLELSHARWQLAITDTNSGDRSVFETADEARASFSNAEWLQEDITNTKARRVYDYPELSPIGFRDLKVNSRAPAYKSVRSSWMSAGASNFAPTPLHNDAFTISPATIGAAGSRYLRIAKREDDADAALEEQASRWTARTPRPQRAAAVKSLVAALLTNDRELAEARWPARVQSMVDELVRESTFFREQLEAVGANPTGAQLQEIAKHPRISEIGLRIRRTLRVPDQTP